MKKGHNVNDLVEGTGKFGSAMLCQVLVDSILPHKNTHV